MFPDRPGNARSYCPAVPTGPRLRGRCPLSCRPAGKPSSFRQHGGFGNGRTKHGGNTNGRVTRHGATHGGGVDLHRFVGLADQLLVGCHNNRRAPVLTGTIQPQRRTNIGGFKHLIQGVDLFNRAFGFLEPNSLIRTLTRARSLPRCRISASFRCIPAPSKSGCACPPFSIDYVPVLTALSDLAVRKPLGDTSAPTARTVSVSPAATLLYAILMAADPVASVGNVTTAHRSRRKCFPGIDRKVSGVTAVNENAGDDGLSFPIRCRCLSGRRQQPPPRNRRSNSPLRTPSRGVSHFPIDIHLSLQLSLLRRFSFNRLLNSPTPRSPRPAFPHW